jgi:cytosine/adenosine deaminase-related metal-dependent hydrolase
VTEPDADLVVVAPPSSQTVGLGCDGSASTDHASLWLEARTALLQGRLPGGPGAMGPAATGWRPDLARWAAG